MSKKEFPIPSYIDLLDTLPHVTKHEVYYFADHVELWCLASIDNECTLADYLKIYSTRKKEFKDGCDMEDEDEDEENDEAENVTVTDAFDTNDRYYNRVKNIFSHLAGRAKFFGDNYPFEINAEATVINLKPKRSEYQNLYLFLLFCSSLQYVKEAMHDITSLFECFSFEIMKSIIPPIAELHFFGSSNTYIKEGRFVKKNFLEKCELLADQIKEFNKTKNANVAPNNRGDGQLDLVAWINSGDKDKENRNILYLAQCACGVSDWKEKQYEPTYENWNSNIDLHTYPVSLMFIPFSYRNGEGAWFNHIEIKRVIMHDRFRCIHRYSQLPKDERLFFTEKNSDFNKILTRLLSAKEAA
jgi:hypothetical protein